MCICISICNCVCICIYIWICICICICICVWICISWWIYLKIKLILSNCSPQNLFISIYDAISDIYRSNEFDIGRSCGWTDGCFASKMVIGWRQEFVRVVWGNVTDHADIDASINSKEILQILNSFNQFKSISSNQSVHQSFISQNQQEIQSVFTNEFKVIHLSLVREIMKPSFSVE